MSGKFMVMLAVTATCWYLSAANPSRGSDQHHNYYLAALSFAGSDLKSENEIPDHRENREKPVVVVEHIHKEEIDEERVRVVPQHHSNCNHQQHRQVQHPYYGFPFYPFQYKASRPQNHNDVNQYYGQGQHHGGSFYGQGYGGYNWRSSNY